MCTPHMAAIAMHCAHVPGPIGMAILWMSYLYCYVFYTYLGPWSVPSLRDTDGISASAFTDSMNRQMIELNKLYRDHMRVLNWNPK